MDMQINFPNLGIYLEHVGKNVEIFGFPIAFYGMTMAGGIIAGYLLAAREAKRTGQNSDDYLDLVMYAVIFSLIGARIYYVIFSWDSYKNDLLSILNFRQGGLAIYGAFIAAVITVFAFTKKRKKSFWQVCDTACLGLLAGQIIGRWGNFFNREAFGDYTDGLLAMQIPVSAVRSKEITTKMWEHLEVINGVEFIQVHPTFLYEGLWNLGILLFLYWYRDRKKFQGEMFFIYMFGYGIGRFWIEGLRTDQLLLPGTGIPVSQLLALVLAGGSALVLAGARIRMRRAANK
ncbi:MAG: prolipoprotein diacylglyceryl transferase [Lachnospiraceae bacterium]